MKSRDAPTWRDPGIFLYGNPGIVRSVPSTLAVQMMLLDQVADFLGAIPRHVHHHQSLAPINR
ncbi:hypothetical protein [Burkholderia cenocepacia]|uniref:hypothetical protein n=1 Tax=Burkholderia cenocepacia TaxID=95486 RepID=UPI0015C55157|nr:hypothetical protein [Burkholderia cenocepacia]